MWWKYMYIKKKVKAVMILNFDLALNDNINE